MPLGGTGDGGADGLEEVFGTKTSHFIQITRQENHKAKIRHTVERLKKVGREPKRLTYITALTIPLLDIEQNRLSDELDVGVTIRDRSYIIAHLNRYPEALAAFNSYLATFVGNLLQIGSTPLFSNISSEQLRSAVVFLSQELENRNGSTPLTEKIVDSLIIWALRNTNPGTRELMNEDMIKSSIFEILPSSRSIVSDNIKKRLLALSSKSHPAGRQINIYIKEKCYFLPYETRLTVQKENAANYLLIDAVFEKFKERAHNISEERGYFGIDSSQVANISLAAIERGFEEQGMSITKSVADELGHEVATFVESVTELVREIGLCSDLAVKTADVTLVVIRHAFYNSEDCERTLFNRWSKTYALLFSIQNNPKIVDWMRKSSVRFHLYVGSDIIIRSITEKFLLKEDKIASNALEILVAAGSTLILAEPVLEEVWTHIVATENEFRNHYQEQEKYLNMQLAQACQRPLIRTYLYAKMRPFEGVEIPKSWGSFLDSFFPYRLIHRTEGKQALKQYLLEKYNMDFESHEDLEKLVDPDKLQDLVDSVVPLKMHKGENAQVLATNDSLMVLSVYGKRLQLKEAHKPNPLGYRTWWLTTETSIRRATTALVKTMGSNYMMRPEFVMQYIALNPSLDSIRKSYAKIFPSTLSISLGARVDDRVLHELLDRLRNSSGYDDARLKVEAASLSNQLMSDFARRYQLSDG